MTSVTTARGEQNTHKTLTIIILLRTLKCVCFICLHFYLFYTPESSSLRQCHKNTPLSSLTAKYPYLSSSKDCKIDRKPSPSPVIRGLAGAEKDNLGSESVWGISIIWSFCDWLGQMMRVPQSSSRLQQLTYLLSYLWYFNTFKPSQWLDLMQIDICFHTEKSDSH